MMTLGSLGDNVEFNKPRDIEVVEDGGVGAGGCCRPKELTGDGAGGIDGGS